MDVKSVYNRQFNRVYRIALMYLKNPHDAEDVTQTVFLRYIEKKIRFKDESHEKAWFITTTRNRCKDVLKAFWQQNVELGELPEVDCERGESVALNMLFELPPKYREVLYMYYYEGYRAREIAAFLNRNESTVQSQLAVGREKLRKMLIEEGYDER